MIARLAAFGGALTLAIAATVPHTVTTYAADVLPFTDSLRAEAARASSLAPRRTVVRRLAFKIDTAAVGCDTIRYATDSLRLEAKRSPGLRRTVVRRLAYKADTLAAGCDTVTPPDTTPPDTTPPDTTPATPPDTTPAVGSDTIGSAVLPVATPLARSPLSASACTDTVTTNLQAAINAATAGDVLCLPTGTTFSAASFTLPKRTDTGWVEIRGLVTQTGNFAPGARIRPSTATTLPTITGTSTSPTLAFATGAHGWALTLLNITTNSALATGPNTIINLSDPSTLADTAYKIHLDRVWLHGWPTQAIIRCIVAHARSLTIIDSWLDDCHAKGYDTQAIVAWGSAGPMLIRNNYLAGAGENIMFGGAKPRITGEVPRDITIQLNHVHTPTTWKGVWTKKNLFEIKNASRVLVERNVFDGSWTDGQTGGGWLWNEANQGISTFTWATVNDVLARENLIVNTVEPMRVASLAAMDSLARRITIADNYSDSINVGAIAQTSSARPFAIYNDVRSLVVVRNTFAAATPFGSTSPLASALVVNDGSKVSATGAVFHSNTMSFGKYGFTGCQTGTGARLSTCLPSATWTGNALITTGSLAGYPAGVTAYGTLSAALTATGSMTRARIDSLTTGVVVAR